MEEEIDLRPYLRALLRRWRLIALFVFIAGIVAVLMTLSKPPVHTAKADVVVLSKRLQLQFDSRFVTDDTTRFANPVTRRDALLALASSGTLEDRVLADLPPALADLSYKDGELIEKIDVELVGDLVRIQVDDIDPQHAEVLATVWAQSYVQLVNEVYGDGKVSVEQIEQQLNEAQQRYSDAQQSLEDFIGSSSAVQIQEQIRSIEGLLNDSREVKQSLYTQYLSRTHELELILNDAQTLRQQAAVTESRNLSDGFVALILRARIAGGEQLPIDLRLDDSSVLAQGNGVVLSDLDTLISVVRQRRAELLALAQQFAHDLSGAQDDAVGLSSKLRTQYEEELTVLKQQFEQQQAQQHFLKQQRDLALDLLSILQRKLDELRVAAGTSQAEVYFVGVALEPPRSRLIQMALNAAVAAMLGLMVVVVVVIVQEAIRLQTPVGAAQPVSERQADHPAASS